MHMLQEKISPIVQTDSYKLSHYKQYPPGTAYVSSYIESRGGKWNKTVFFGLQMFVKDVLLNPITVEQINYAENLAERHGVPFNREGWMHICNEHDGYLPIQIEAVPEGTVIDGHNVLVQIRNTDPLTPWLTSYVETALLRAIWYPTTVATLSFEAKRRIYKGLIHTAEDPWGEIGFKLHDFGARGVSSSESAAIGGLAHLVNFYGTDTLEALVAAETYYQGPDDEVAGFSIPAAEHSTITSWGRENESLAFANMIDQFGGEGKLVAVVSDSYDIWKAVTEKWGDELLDKVKESGATIVVRPDSGDPVTTPVDVIEMLMECVGYEVNSKGFKVLPSYFRVIQGDGMSLDNIRAVVEVMISRRLSLTNIAFGMGGGLLQQVDRDTLKFAMKQNAIIKDESFEWIDVYKDPVTDSGKKSKRGRLALIKVGGAYQTITRAAFDQMGGVANELRVVYEGGLARRPYYKLDTLNRIRDRAAAPFLAIDDEVYATGQ